MLNFSKFSLILVILSSFILDLSGQSSKRPIKKKTNQKEEVNIWREKVWYGGGFNLQLYQQALSTSIVGNVFEFGLSPLAGYKIKPWLSAGPRLEFTYIGGRFPYSPKVLKLNGFNFGVGAFARAKFLKVLFAHVEYSTISTIELTGNINNNRLETDRKFIPHFFTGLGYNPSGDWSYEFYILYDFLSDPESTQLPIQYRAGLTYKF